MDDVSLDWVLFEFYAYDSIRVHRKRKRKKNDAANTCLCKRNKNDNEKLGNV